MALADLGLGAAPLDRTRSRDRAGRPGALGAGRAPRQSAPEAPITHAVALESGRVILPHRDAADRFLVATARLLDLALITADARLLAVSPCKLLANP